MQLKPDSEDNFWKVINKILKDNNITKSNGYDIDLLLEDLYDYMRFDGQHSKYRTWTQTIDRLIKIINDPDYDMDIPDADMDYTPSKPKEHIEQKLRKIVRTEIKKILNENNNSKINLYNSVKDYVIGDGYDYTDYIVWDSLRLPVETDEYITYDFSLKIPAKEFSDSSIKETIKFIKNQLNYSPYGVEGNPGGSITKVSAKPRLRGNFWIVDINVTKQLDI